MKRFRPPEIAACPLKAVPREETRQARWLKPELVAEVEFAEWTGDGVLRHPAFKGLREDKDPRKIRRDIRGVLRGPPAIRTGFAS